MTKLGRPRGLIDYEAWANIERGRRREPLRRRVIRPKTVALGLSVIALIALMGVGLGLRGDAKITVIHDRNPVAVRLSDGRRRNGYTVRLYNKAGRERSFRLDVLGFRRAESKWSAGTTRSTSPPTPPASCACSSRPHERDRQTITFIATDIGSGQPVTAQDVFIPIEGGR